MWIEKLKNGKYKFVERYEDPYTGKTKRVSVTMKNQTNQTKRMAQEFLDKKIQERVRTEDIITFKELANQWFSIYEENVKQSTSRNVRLRMNKIMRSLGHLNSNQIEPATINKYLLNLLQVDKLKYNVVSNDKSIIVRILIFGMQYGYVQERNYKDMITIPSINQSKKDDMKYLEVDEFRSVIEQLQQVKQYEVARMCQIQAATGMRYNEMVALDYVKDIDLENQTINIAKNYDHHNNLFTTPKTGENRMIHISDETTRIIEEQINYDKLKMVKFNLDRNNTLLFRQKNERPRHIRYVNKILKNVKITDKNVTTHIFRHTFITLMIQNGIKPRLVAEHVGHSSTKMIDQVYAHFTKEMDNELKNAIQSLVII